jgi:hypothetical protein
VTASAAKPGVLSMSWTHPKAWKNLRDITVKAYDGAKQVGAVTITPRSERITGTGLASNSSPRGDGRGGCR